MDDSLQETDGRWLDVADRVYARRYTELDLTVGLVVGHDGCLVVDSRGDVVQGAELAEYGESARRTRIAEYRSGGKPEIADALARTTITPPNRVLSEDVELDLGGRVVRLVHPGLAHTDHDLVVHVPDAGVVFAGDTVEHGPHGWTADSFSVDTRLTHWPSALDAILALAPRVVVPGHGEPVDAAFVAKHRDGLAQLAALRNAVAAAEITVADAVTRSPYPEDVTRAALVTT